MDEDAAGGGARGGYKGRAEDGDGGAGSVARGGGGVDPPQLSH